MIVNCSICGRGFQSLLVEREKAIAEVSEGFVKHMTKEHIPLLQILSRELSGVLQLSTWFISMQFLLVDDEEKQFHEQFVKQGAKILQLLGFSEGQIKAVEVKHQTRKVENGGGIKLAGTIVTQ